MSKIQHEPFMIAVEEKGLVVRVVCSHPQAAQSDRPHFRKCTYEIVIPKESGTMGEDQIFETAKDTFLSVRDLF